MLSVLAVHPPYIDIQTYRLLQPYYRHTELEIETYRKCTHTQRLTDIETSRHADTEKTDNACRHRGSLAYIHKCRHIDKLQTYQRNRQYRQANLQLYRHLQIQSHGYTGPQLRRRTLLQTCRYIQTYRHVYALQFITLTKDCRLHTISYIY